MANTIEQANEDIANISSTSTGLIQKSSLTPILTLITLLVSGRTFTVADAAALQDLNPEEATTVIVIGEGVYTYDADAGSGTYPALGGGYWILQNLAALASLLDVVLTSPADGQVLKFNASTGKWENGNQAVANIGWANVTDKPIIAGTTNPAIAGSLSVGGTLGVTGAASFGNNLGIALALTIGTTLGVTGLATLLGGLNLTGNLTMTGNQAVTGDLVANSGTFGPLTISDLASFFGDVKMTLTNYASNAAALAGGLVATNLYRNGDNVCVVH